MRRSDRPAIRDTVIWVGLMVLSAGLGILLWGSWWAVPFFLAYGVLYGSASDSRWHEAGHGTAFATRWLDEAVYQLASFMMMRDPTASRWSTPATTPTPCSSGRDPEIHGDAPGPAGQDPRQPRRPRRRAGRVQGHVPARQRPADRGGGRLRPGVRAAEGVPDGPDLAGDLRRRDRCGGRSRFLAAAGADRRAAAVRHVHAHRLRADPARGHGRERARPPAQHPHRADERGQPVPVLEHELPRRAPHVPDGSLPPAARVARARSSTTWPLSTRRSGRPTRRSSRRSCTS